MPQIFFLSSFGKAPTNDNWQRFSNTFQSIGWDVVTVDHESLTIENNTLYGYDAKYRMFTLNDQVDLFWLIGFGEQTTFLDRMQWLRSLPQRKFINSVDTLVYSHGKPYFLLSPLGEYHPRSVVGGREFLIETVEKGGTWIAKPNAGSFGRDVFQVSKEDPNYRVILENLTASGSAMLQTRVSTVNEKRVLLGGGKIVGTYGKKPFDHRGNLAAKSAPTTTSLESHEEELAHTCARELQQMNICFATLDMAYPYILDINIANPGWLETFEQLTGEDLTLQLVNSIIRGC